MRRKLIFTILLVAIYALVNVAADDKETKTTKSAETTTTEINTTESLTPTTTTTEIPKNVDEDENKIIKDKNESTPKSTPTPVKPAINGVGVRASFGDGPPGSPKSNGAGSGGFVGYGVHTTGGNGQVGASSFAGASSGSNGFGGGFGGIGGAGGFRNGFPAHWGPSGYAGPVGPGGSVARVGTNGVAGVTIYNRSGFVGGPETAFAGLPPGFGGFWSPRLSNGAPIEPKAPANPVTIPSEGKTVVIESRSDSDSPPKVKVHLAQGGFGGPQGFGSFPVFGPEGFSFPRPEFRPTWAAGGKAPVIYPPQLAGRFDGGTDDDTGNGVTVYKTPNGISVTATSTNGSPNEPKGFVTAADGKPIATDPKSKDSDSPKVNAVDPAVHGGYGVPGSYGGFGAGVGGFSSAGSSAGPNGYGGFVGPNGFGTFGYPPQVAGRFSGGTDDDTGNGVTVHKPPNGISVTATSTNGSPSEPKGTVSSTAIANDGKPVATDPKSKDSDSPKVNAMDPAVHSGFGVPGSYGGFGAGVGGLSSAGSFAGPNGYGGFVGPNGFGTFGYPPQVAGRFAGGTDDDNGNGVTVHKTPNGIIVTSTSKNDTDSATVGTASFSGSDGQGGFNAFAGAGGFSGGFGYPGGFGSQGGFGFENSFGSYGR